MVLRQILSYTFPVSPIFRIMLLYIESKQIVGVTRGIWINSGSYIYSIWSLSIHKTIHIYRILDSWNMLSWTHQHNSWGFQRCHPGVFANCDGISRQLRRVKLQSWLGCWAFGTKHGKGPITSPRLSGTKNGGIEPYKDILWVGFPLHKSYIQLI